jgi:hypothetical protein
MLTGRPGSIPGRAGRQNGQTGGKILTLVLFRLVGPPLQPGVVGPYLVRGVWFPSRLLLKEIGRIQNLGP